jgi:hypothetical protein
LRKHLWRAERKLLFLKPEFFAVPGLGRQPATERSLVLFGAHFLKLEERFGELLGEFEYVLGHLHWSRVHAHLRAHRAGTFELSWRAIYKYNAARDAPTREWEFEGPRSIEILHDGTGATKE